MRQYGNERTPLAMFSRSLAGSIGQTLIICLPGSFNGARESLDAVKLQFFGLSATLDHEEHFRPGKPVPTHRDGEVTEVKGGCTPSTACC